MPCFRGTEVRPENVHIAGIDHAAIELGRQRYGFVPAAIDETGRLPFPMATSTSCTARR